jgi:hypothetical protein
MNLFVENRVVHPDLSSDERARIEVWSDLGYPAVHEPKDLAKGDYLAFLGLKIGYDM